LRDVVRQYQVFAEDLSEDEMFTDMAAARAWLGLDQEQAVAQSTKRKTAGA
jgi:hypothetical protein